MRTLQRIALILATIGAINWGLIGFFSFDDSQRPHTFDFSHELGRFFDR